MRALCKALKCKPADLYQDFKRSRIHHLLETELEQMLIDYMKNIRSKDKTLKMIALKQYALLIESIDRLDKIAKSDADEPMADELTASRAKQLSIHKDTYYPEVDRDGNPIKSTYPGAEDNEGSDA